MRIILFSLCLIIGTSFTAALLSQNVEQNAAAPSVSGQVAQEQRKLRAAKERNRISLGRSNALRNRASETGDDEERFNFERQAINADIDAAVANLDAARARIAIISLRQSVQQRELSQQTSPILRLMGALENMTRRPATLMIMQPQSLDDYVHLRAIMASVQPKIEQQTAGLRAQIDLQQSLRNQQKLALESLEDAQTDLAKQQASLAQLEGGSRNQSGELSADVALEFERAIAAGERARDIVDNIENIQQDDEALAALSVLDGPKLRGSQSRDADSDGGVKTRKDNNRPAYILPSRAQIRSGFSELSVNGYRERGIRMMVPASSAIKAPAGGTIKYAGVYRNFGRIVIIEHGGGWATLITNMAAVYVDEGQNIDQGDDIGTAKSIDNEILIELRRNGRPMDIMALVSG